MKIKNNFKESNFGKFGIEEEFQIVDPNTFDLVPRSKDLLLQLDDNRFSDEIFLSTIESNTPICEDISQARGQIKNLRKQLKNVANQNGLLISSAGTHPFANWEKQVLNPKPRYFQQMKENNGLNQLEVVYGLHVHFGVNNIKQSMRMYHNFREVIPYIVALSSNSPFWESKECYQSTRLHVLDKVPQYGYPKKMKTWKEYYNNLVELSSVYQSIKSEKDVFWDVRLRPDLGTVEVRALDAQTDRNMTLAMVAFVLLVGNHFKNNWLELGSDHLKRTACIKYGIKTTFSNQQVSDIINNLLKEMEPTQDKLGLSKEIRKLMQVIKLRATPADYQKQLYQKTKSFPKLVKKLCEVTIK